MRAEESRLPRLQGRCDHVLVFGRIPHVRRFVSSVETSCVGESKDPPCAKITTVRACTESLSRCTMSSVSSLLSLCKSYLMETTPARPNHVGNLQYFQVSKQVIQAGVVKTGRCRAWPQLIAHATALVPRPCRENISTASTTGSTQPY